MSEKMVTKRRIIHKIRKRKEHNMMPFTLREHTEDKKNRRKPHVTEERADSRTGSIRTVKEKEKNIAKCYEE